MRLLTVSILASLLLLSCATGKKAYERGDYFNATIQAVNRLRSNPGSEKAQEALRRSYPAALGYFQEKIENALRSNRQFRYSEVVDYYVMMNHMADEIRRCPAALSLFPQPKSFESELAEAKYKAAEEHYQAGLDQEKLNTRTSWKSAYLNFNEADCFVPGFKDAKERMRIAYLNATWKVIVEPIPVPNAYQLTSDFFRNQVIEYLRNERPNEFVEYYTPESAEKAGIKKPDQVLRMSFDQFVIGQVYDKETITELSRDSVVTGTVRLPDGTEHKVYGTVKAKLRTFRREVISNGVLDVSVIDWPLNQLATERKFPGQFIW
ncbi:MAG TPA: hypothetical protein PKM34_09810, partial [Bacteroidales bacterium]|nr:hypothetical protein [Bacteroidales bacterium]